MKKWICFLLIIGMIFSSCPVFAQSQAIEYNLDERISPLLTIDIHGPQTYAGDITFASNGTILLQQVEADPFYHDINQGDDLSSLDRLYIKHLRQNGDVIASADLDWNLDPFSFHPFASFVAQDPKGFVYTSSPQQLYMLPSDLSQPLDQGNFRMPPASMFEIDLQGNTALIAQRVLSQDVRAFNPEGDENNHSQIALDYISFVPFTGEKDTLFSSMIILPAENLASLFGKSAYVMEVDFAETADTLYVLVYDDGKTDQEPVWKIAKVKFTIAPSKDQDSVIFDVIDEGFTLQDAKSTDMALCYEFDGENHQVVFFQESDVGVKSIRPEINESTLSRFDITGALIDSIKLPGNIYAFDARDDKSIIALNAYPTEHIGHYMINWKSPSTGSPSSLIHERTMKGKTMAIFRDKGYGLLRKENPDTGIIDYLAPLKTEESDVRLRIPFCDLIAKIQNEGQNLEILYGQDRINIPMSQLDVRDLLSQMPCDTDATIELHLIRNEDGSVQTTAELFVVEQVNAQTKRVHRLPITLQ